MPTYIDNNTSWEQLPWPKIKQRIFILQQKISIASETCNKDSLFRAQNELINSNEAKVMAIQEICRSVRLYYLNLNKDQYNIRNTGKLFMLKFLFHQNFCLSHKKINFLLDQINQYLVHLCMEPQWRLQLEPIFPLKIFAYKFHVLYHRIAPAILSQDNFNNHSISHACSDTCIMSKYLNICHLKQQVQSPAYFISRITKWLQLRSFQEISSLSYSIDFYASYNQIFTQLLHKISLNGIQWLDFFTSSSTNKASAESIKKINSSIAVKSKSTNLDSLASRMGYNVLLLNLKTFSQAIRTDSSIFLASARRILKAKNSNLSKNIKSNLLKDLCKKFLSGCKSLLYKKDSFNRLRLRFHLKAFAYVNKALNELKVFYTSCCTFLSLSTIDDIYKIINTALYLYQKKKFKNLNYSHMQFSYQSFVKHLIDFKKTLLYNICIAEVNRR